MLAPPSSRSRRGVIVYEDSLSTLLIVLDEVLDVARHVGWITLRFGLVGFCLSLFILGTDGICTRAIGLMSFIFFDGLSSFFGVFSSLAYHEAGVIDI